MGRRLRLWALLGFDVVLVIVFAAIGRASHHEANPVLAALDTAWPFLAAMLAGWIIAYFNWARTIPVTVPSGVTVWVATVCLGMVLRHLVGRGTAPSFVLVATIVLGVFLIGWRALFALRGRRRQRPIAQ